jgi:hypothetical protein
MTRIFIWDDAVFLNADDTDDTDFIWDDAVFLNADDTDDTDAFIAFGNDFIRFISCLINS